MAKRRAVSSGIQVYRAPPMAAPVIKVSAPRPVKAAPRKRRHSGGGGGGGGGGTKNLMGVTVGAGLLGVLKKAGLLSKVPNIPFIGRIGATAIAAHFWAKNGGGALARDISLAAASIAAFQMGSEGSIDGDDDVLLPPPPVRAVRSVRTESREFPWIM